MTGVARSIKRNPRVPVDDQGCPVSPKCAGVPSCPPRSPQWVFSPLSVILVSEAPLVGCSWALARLNHCTHGRKIHAEWPEGSIGRHNPIAGDPIKAQGPMGKQASVWISKLSLMDRHVMWGRLDCYDGCTMGHPHPLIGGS